MPRKIVINLDTGFLDATGQHIYNTDTVNVGDRPGVIGRYNGVWYVVFAPEDHERLSRIPASTIRLLPKG